MTNWLDSDDTTETYQHDWLGSSGHTPTSHKAFHSFLVFGVLALGIYVDIA